MRSVSTSEIAPLRARAVQRGSAACPGANGSRGAELGHGPTRLFHPPAPLGIFSNERRVTAQTYKHLFGRTGEVLCCRMHGMDPQKVLL